MLELTLPILETTINRAMALDPASQARLAKLQGKLIQFTISDWLIDIYITPQRDGLQLQTHTHSVPDVSISARLPDLIALSVKNIDTEALFQHPLKISGDTQLGEEVRAIFQSIDIDWEEQVSKIFGDTIAYKMGKIFRHTRKSINTVVNSFNRNVNEYLHFESRLCPASSEINLFCAEVDTLRNDIERANARIEILTREIYRHV